MSKDLIIKNLIELCYLMQGEIDLTKGQIETRCRYEYDEIKKIQAKTESNRRVATYLIGSKPDSCA